MTDVPFRFDEERLLWTVDDVYSTAECSSFVQLIETSSPTLATNNPLYRDESRAPRRSVSVHVSAS
jgi:hypothetical protein